jgi:putative spermidine/putrescine transport system substrate-binding protein
MTNRLKATTGVAAACIASVFLASCGGQQEAQQVDLGSGEARAGTVKKGALDGLTLSFVSYGGIYQDGQMEAAGKPFAEESGAEILSDGPTDYTKIKAQVESQNVTWDVVDTDTIWAEAQCGKLLMPLDFDLIDTSKVPEELIGECTVPAMSYGYILMYDKSEFGDNPPQGWTDFFDTEKFPGKRAINGVPSDAAPGSFEAALIADGVKPEDLYPLDVDRALEKLSTIRDDIVFWQTGAESQQLLESGEVAMAMVWSGRGYSAVKNGADYEAQWNEWMPIKESLSVPKGVRNPDAAMAFINYYIGAEQQAKLTELTSYAPINSDAKPDVDALTKSYLTTNPEYADLSLPVDTKWWADNQADVIEKWSAWLGG